MQIIIMQFLMCKKFTTIFDGSVMKQFILTSEKHIFITITPILVVLEPTIS
jgi:hypothetical protein